MICPPCGGNHPFVFNELSAGMRIEIFLRTEQGLVSEGMAILIEKAPSWRGLEPYPIVLHCKKCRTQCNAVDERWKVRFDNGFETARWIPLLAKPGIIHVRDSFDLPSDEEEEGLLD